MHGLLYFLPALLQIWLTIFLYLALAVAKSRAVKAGKVDVQRRALHADAWPENVQKINNSIRNQFEVPVLFYVLVLILWELNQTGWLVQTMAWLFVLSRYLHAWVHTGSNYVPLRRRVFLFGCMIVVALVLMVGVTGTAN